VASSGAVALLNFLTEQKLGIDIIDI